MIFSVDSGLFLLIALGACMGIAGTFSSWILDNMVIVLVLLVLKSVLLFSDAGLFARKENEMHTVCTVMVLLIDVGRNMLFLYCIAQILGGMFSGGLFKFFMGILNLLIGGPLLFLAGEGPMYLVYEEGISHYDDTKFGILFEIVSIVALLLVAWWGDVF